MSPDQVVKIRKQTVFKLILEAAEKKLTIAETLKRAHCRGFVLGRKVEQERKVGPLDLFRENQELRARVKELETAIENAYFTSMGFKEAKKT